MYKINIVNNPMYHQGSLSLYREIYYNFEIIERKNIYLTDATSFFFYFPTGQSEELKR